MYVTIRRKICRYFRYITTSKITFDSVSGRWLQRYCSSFLQCSNLSREFLR